MRVSCPLFLIFLGRGLGFGVWAYIPVPGLFALDHILMRVDGVQQTCFFFHGNMQAIHS
ncbi:unnamed protein product [Periconia digitata]|uniref:Uncharacterized protein n=1 Tax=Periconia digitata TaxID=1303443 RepID=A0A9W4XVL3_9PLEO|nr:unnamed protein product [Periconia digitata]